MPAWTGNHLRPTRSVNQCSLGTNSRTTFHCTGWTDRSSRPLRWHRYRGLSRRRPAWNSTRKRPRDHGAPARYGAKTATSTTGKWFSTRRYSKTAYTNCYFKDRGLLHLHVFSVCPFNCKIIAINLFYANKNLFMNF